MVSAKYSKNQVYDFKDSLCIYRVNATSFSNFKVAFELLGSLSNEDGNVNENAAKQRIKLQNTITARGNATTWPLFRRRL